MFPKFVASLGVIFLIAAAYLYIGAIRASALDLRPLSVPISLVSGTVKTAEVRTDIDYWDYEIAIDFQPKFDPHQMKCLLGGEINSDGCNDIPRLNDISWEFLEGEKVAAEGNSGSTAGWLMESGALYERPIGYFKARKGHRYRLVLHVNSDASELNIANPAIVVEIPRGYWEDHAIGIGFGKLFAGILGAIGAAILVGTLALSKLKRREHG